MTYSATRDLRDSCHFPSESSFHKNIYLLLSKSHCWIIYICHLKSSMKLRAHFQEIQGSVTKASKRSGERSVVGRRTKEYTKWTSASYRSSVSAYRLEEIRKEKTKKKNAFPGDWVSWSKVGHSIALLHADLKHGRRFAITSN